MSKPDFLCIGMQKGGTTWLYNVLKNHPQLGLLPAKELVYFNSYGIEEHKQWPLYHRRRQAIQGLAHELNTGKNLDHNEDFFNRLRWYSKFSSTKVSKEWYENLFDIAPDDAVKGDFTPDYIMLPCDIIREIKNNYPNVKAIFSARSPIDRTWSHVKMIVRNEGHDLADESKIQGIIQREDVKRRGFFSEDMKNWANVFDDNFFFYKFEYIKTSP
uniref:sulfotransferase n=1 Tax=Marisediminitalea sp. TaxID=2662268 RepID=UPI003515A509